MFCLFYCSFSKWNSTAGKQIPNPYIHISSESISGPSPFLVYSAHLSSSDGCCQQPPNSYLPAGPSGHNSSIMQTMIMAISARTSEPRLSWELLKTICYDPAIQELMLTKSQGLPVRRDVVESPQAQQLFTAATPGSEEMNLKIVSQVMDDSMTEPKFPRYKEAMNLADHKLLHIVQENMSLSSALSQVQKEINAYLQQ